MPGKKKKGKCSKLARMSDEERLRYLQHRSELELEAKRRKQQLIAAFSKLKLQKEKVFTRLNNAKINEQWRGILRKIKRRELHEIAIHFSTNFEKTVEAKDAVISQLYHRLHEADMDHRRLHEAHLDQLDRLINESKRRFRFLENSYSNQLENVKANDIKDFDQTKEQMQESSNFLRSVIYTQDKKIEEKFWDARKMHAISTQKSNDSNDERISSAKSKIATKMQDSWTHLNEIIEKYEKNIKDKKEEYELMKELDDSCREEAKKFPKLQSKLQKTVENLTNGFQNLRQKKLDENIEELKKQSEFLNEKFWRIRQEMKTSQMIDTLKLKRLSVTINRVLKNLQRIQEKSTTVSSLLKICSDLEKKGSLSIRKFPENVESENTLTDSAKIIESMQKFWYFFNQVKSENLDLKKEKNQLLLQSNKWQLYLRCYIFEISHYRASSSSL